MEMKIVAGNLLLGVAYSEAIAPTILQVSEWLRSDPTCARTDFCLISPNQCEVRSYNVQYECALGTGFRTHLPSCKRKTATTPSPSKLSLCQPATKNTHTQTLLLFLNTHKKTTRHFILYFVCRTMRWRLWVGRSLLRFPAAFWNRQFPPSSKPNFPLRWRKLCPAPLLLKNAVSWW